MPNAGATGPRLSVIIAAWNAGATIATAVGSVLEQRDVPLECVVVDDGSTDGTATALAGLAAADERLVVVRLSANAGVSAARNRALDTVRGDWIAYLDADDRLLPGGLGAMVRAGDDADALAVVGQRISTDGERTWFPKLYDLPDIRTPGRKSLAANPDLLYYAGPAGKLFRRPLADGLRFEGRVLGDQPWILRALVRAGDRIVVVEDVVYEWRRPGPSHEVATLTSAREHSATLGAEAVRMAGVAFATVASEFDRAYDPETSARMQGAYVRRLIRADLGHQLHEAVARRDPALPVLLDALGDLANSLPAAAVAAAGDAWRGEVVEFLALHWSDMSKPARDSALNLYRRLRSLDPATISRVRRRSLRWPLRLGVTGPHVVGPIALTAGLGTVDRLASCRRRLRRRS